jgi:hypothetical protein
MTGTGVKPIHFALMCLSKICSMNGQVEDVWITEGEVLNAISMMYVPIKNENSVGLARMDGMLRSYSNIVEVTES